MGRVIIERLDQNLDGCVTAAALEAQRALAHGRKEVRWLQPLGNVVLQPEPLQASARQNDAIELALQCILQSRLDIAPE
jgi:hypothetical protein